MDWHWKGISDYSTIDIVSIYMFISLCFNTAGVRSSLSRIRAKAPACNMRNKIYNRHPDILNSLPFLGLDDKLSVSASFKTDWHCCSRAARDSFYNVANHCHVGCNDHQCHIILSHLWGPFTLYFLSRTNFLDVIPDLNEIDVQWQWVCSPCKESGSLE